jgi:oxygen-dependent protoporphyrinogen oxidase
MSTDANVLVIGGGLTGLATAFYLMERGVPVEVLEAAASAGGVIGTRRRDGALTEAGPNSTLDTTPLINVLLDRLGIRDQRRDASAVASTRFIVRGGRLVALPGSPGAFFTTPAFSLGAKLALLREPFIGRAPAGTEESIAAFVRRRLGNEFLDYAIDPFVSGVYAGDPDEISVPAAFPRLHALEQKYGSLIKGQIKGARERRANAETAKNSAGSFSFRAGMQTLTDALAMAVGRVETDVDVTRIAKAAGGGFRVEGAQRDAFFVRTAKAVVLAAPAYAAAVLAREIAPSAVPHLEAIEYAPIAIAASCYRRSDIAHPLAGFGFLVPKKERRKILGSLFSSSMFEGRAPYGSVLLTTFIGGKRQPELAALPDAEIAAIVHEELTALVGAAAAPQWSDIKRWKHAIPQYTLGHLGRIAALEAAETSAPGLFLRGSYRDGVSVGDRIKAAQASADAVIHQLG